MPGSPISYRHRRQHQPRDEQLIEQRLLRRRRLQRGGADQHGGRAPQHRRQQAQQIARQRRPAGRGEAFAHGHGKAGQRRRQADHLGERQPVAGDQVVRAERHHERRQVEQHHAARGGGEVEPDVEDQELDAKTAGRPAGRATACRRARTACTPRSRAQANTSTPASSERRPTCRVGEMPALAILMADLVDAPAGAAGDQHQHGAHVEPIGGPARPARAASLATLMHGRSRRQRRRQPLQRGDGRLVDAAVDPLGPEVALEGA